MEDQLDVKSMGSGSSRSTDEEDKNPPPEPTQEMNEVMEYKWVKGAELGKLEISLRALVDALRGENSPLTDLHLDSIRTIIFKKNEFFDATFHTIIAVEEDFQGIKTELETMLNVLRQLRLGKNYFLS